MQATVYDKKIADLFCLAYYGKSFSEITQAREKAEAAKEKERKIRLQLQLKQRETISNLYFQCNMDVSQIATVMNLDKTYIEKVVKEASTKK